MSTSVYAQLSPPSVVVAAGGVSTLPLSASEAAYHVATEEDKLSFAVSIKQARVPKDSMLAVVSASAQQWLTKLNANQGNSIRGIQLEPSGRVGIAAGQEAYAKAQIATRLATPGLSFADKAFTYLSAVQAFANASYPERLSVAEEYLKQLDAMGDSASTRQFQARISLMQVYYTLGKSGDVARHGTQAIKLSNVMPFVDRELMFPQADDLAYTMTVEAVTGQPGSREKIEALHNILRAAAATPPSLAALDPSFVRRGQLYQRRLKSFLRLGALFGTTGAPIASNYWLNRPTRDSAIVAVNDGKIRVLEVGSYTCPGCIAALPGMQRLQDRFPGIEVMMLTWTTGYWGNRLLTPDEEAEKLTDFYLNKAKVTIPIALWKGKKVLNEEGGMEIEDAGPNLVAYPMIAKPMIWVLDGKGTVRRILAGFSRDQEDQLANTIEFLQREAQSGAQRSVSQN